MLNLLNPLWWLRAIWRVVNPHSWRGSQALWRRLPVRIALLIMVMGPTLLFAAVLLLRLYAQVLQEWRPLTILELPLLLFPIPFILGVMAAKFVSQPLRQLTQGIAAVQQSNYQIELTNEGVAEFDEVVAAFNQLVERLRHEEELRRNLISDTSHELNTPVAALYGQLKGISDGVLALDDERLSLLLSQIERLEELVERLQEYASIRSEAVAPKMEKIKVREVVERVVEEINGKNWELEIENREDEGEYKRQFKISNRHSPVYKIDVPAEATVLADPHLLEEILINLISNSLRYARGSTITVTFHDNVLTVADDGCGVPQEALLHLFERFYRVDSSRSRETGGLGLGLAIVKELVEVMGWQIVAENAHPGLRFEIAVM